MYVTPFVCPTCGNPKVSRAVSRFIDIRQGNATDKEIFSLLGIEESYSRFEILKKKDPKLSEKDLFIKSKTGLDYKDFLRIKRNEAPGVSAMEIYKIFGLSTLCCMRSVLSAPVWPNYSTTRPPYSSLEIDVGKVERYVRQNGMQFETGEISDATGIYVESKVKTQNDVEFDVDDDELRNLDV